MGLIYESCGSVITKTMLERLESFPFYTLKNDENETDNEAYVKHQSDKEWSCWSLSLGAYLIQKRVFWMSASTAFFIWKYYMEKCIHRPDGSWVGRLVQDPVGDYLPFLSFITGPLPMVAHVPVNEQAPVRWQMP